MEPGCRMTWTAADAAEQDVLIDELVICYFEHLETCDKCQARRVRRGEPCPRLQTAIEIVLDWRRRRELLSRAEELRFEQARLNLDIAA